MTLQELRDWHLEQANMHTARGQRFDIAASASRDTVRIWHNLSALEHHTHAAFHTHAVTVLEQVQGAMQ